MKTHTIGNSTSILADCNEYMRMCTPKQFDLLISDPPYFNDSNDRFEKFINQEAKNYKLWV